MAGAVLLQSLHAQGRKRNPASKVYVSDVSGDALIDTGETIEDLSKRSVYSAQGAVIETKRPVGDADRSKAYSTMVYSNGTGAFFDADTRVEVKQFVQEPFTPHRTDMDVEPSISQTQAFVSRGAVGLCTSKLVAGSSMVYQTPHGSVNIRGRKVVIEARPNETRIAMLEGESTVRAGATDLGGTAVKAGEMAVIRRNSAGQTTAIEVVPIPPAEMPALDEKVAMACMAKRTVYFEVREQTLDGSQAAGGETPVDGAAADEGDGTITAFDGDNAKGPTTVREIVPVEVVPGNLPVQFVVSPASIIPPGQGRPPAQPGPPGS